MFPVSVNVDQLVEEFSLTQQEVEGLMQRSVQEVAAKFAKNWSQVVEKNLTNTRKQYIENIIVGDSGKFGAYVLLTGWLPNAIESGHGSYDLKPFFKASDKAKTKKDGKGWYLTIPFRMATEGALGESDVFSGQMEEGVEKILQKKPQDKMVSGGGRSTEPIKKEELPKKARVPSVKQVQIPESGTFAKYKRKSAKMEGVRRQEDPATGQNVYMSFRRVSDESSESSWIHPGFEARNFADKALEKTNIQATVDMATDRYLQQLGFE